MNLRNFCLGVCCICFLTASVMAQQMQKSDEAKKARVVDLLFPSDVPQNPFFFKMVLRFDDSDSQIVIVVYPDQNQYWIRKCEVSTYTVVRLDNARLSERISKMIATNPQESEREIAASIKVDVTRVNVAPEAIQQSLRELRSIRISPLLV